MRRWRAYDKYDILPEGRDEKEFRAHAAVQPTIEIGLSVFWRRRIISVT